MKRLAVFASGSGTNAENLIKYFRDHNKDVEIGAVFTNREKAGVVQIGKKYGVPVYIFTKQEFYESRLVLEQLKNESIDFIVLAGFLLLVPEYLVNSYPKRIVNIHPALLPKYGGKGMYGDKVHKAVKEHRESVTGITIHYVNKEYDMGQTIAEYTCKIDPLNESIEEIKAKVQKLEYTYYPEVIEQVLEEQGV